jgi:polyisoprenoid-binding protein YceI
MFKHQIYKNMNKLLTASAVLAISGITLTAFKSSKTADTPSTKSVAPVATKWAIDKAHTNIIFSVSHLVVSDVEGKFKSFDGWMESDKADFSDAKIGFTVDINSISTDNDMRDKHLKSDDFFNAEKFPQMKFESTSFTLVSGNKYKLAGNLTIRDVTKPITFDVTYGGTVNAFGGVHAGFKAKTTLNRFDYNLKWSATTEAGGLVAGKDVDITINIDMKKS